MRGFWFSFVSSATLGSLLVLNACGGNGSPVGTNPVTVNGANAESPPSGVSEWMARDAKTRDLLYVSNRKDGSLYAYSYPQGKLQGWLLNVHAGGLCSDESGDVFVPQDNEVRELAHGETRTIAVLHDPLGGATQFCAVDPVTGNLAVSGGAARRSGVAVYTNSTGDAHVYSDFKGAYWSSTYDKNGNLFVEAAAGLNRAPTLLELPKGGARFRAIGLKGARPEHLGSIQWDGRYLAASSFDAGSGQTTLFRYAVSGRQASLVSRATLPGTGSHLQLSIHDAQVIVPSRGVSFYGYPGGNGPTQIVASARDPQAAIVSQARHAKIAVTTYHYDNMRTGWDDNETALTYATVSGGSFGLQHTVTLDDQVDTQPLIVPNETTTRGTTPGKHDVVYVTTENDTVYAIDASSGTVLFQQSLGSPVPTPLGCNNNGPNVGIDGTPVIDRHANVMYVIAYTMQASTPAYTLHELSLADLSDVVTPVAVTASHKLSDGSTFTFNATYQRQRPALLKANGNIYAGFGSFCDFAASQSRGWLLGWQAGTLTPLPANQLNDTQSTSPDDFFLSSIWMSGYGVAADEGGNVFFVTGNSDYSGNTYNSVTNIAESVAKVSSDLTQVRTFFTPSDVGLLDEYDADFGSGGVLLLPKTGSQPPLAAAAGKDGNLYLMNRKSLGGYVPSGPDHVFDTVNIGGCWCGQSYFDAASDSVPRIVASGGNTVTVLKVPTARPIKFQQAGSLGLPSGQDPGFFTVVSSNGKAPGAIIWALARPTSVPGTMTLFALSSESTTSGGQLQTLFQATAGSWASSGGNANIVPVVANGKVYVASYQQLAIFGLGANAKGKAITIKAPHIAYTTPHEVTGTLVETRGSRLALRTRTGRVVRVDDSDAVRHERSVDLVVGRVLDARGTYDAAGVLRATSIVRAKPSPASWPADR